MLDGVVQHAGDAYTISGNQITFSAATASGMDFYGIIMGQAASFAQGSIGADELKVADDGSANQILVSDGDGTFSWATNALNSTHISVADNESTNENNLIPFIEDASATGNVGLESDGDLHYNPSTGRLTATQLAGTLQTAAQANITSVGTLSSLTTSGSAGSAYVGSFTNTSATGWGLFVKGGADNADYTLRVQDKDAADLLSVKAGGRVGVLTNDPSHTMVLKTDSGGSTNVLKIEEKDSTDTLVQLSFGGDYDEGSIHVYNGGTSKINLRGNGSSYINGGSLGIGTDSPGYQLDLRRNDTGTTTSLGIRQIGTGDASMAFQTTTSPYGFCIGVDGSDSDAFKIATGTDDVGTNTKLSIDNSGDVTISELLYVNNAVNHGRTTAGATFRAANNGNAAITLLSSANHSAGVGTAIVALNFAATMNGLLPKMVYMLK